MFKLLILISILFTASVKSQDFGSLISSVVEQWGQLTPEQYLEFFNSFQQFGLHHIWHGLNEHCSSNVECGPDACCLKPIIVGKRAITDGTQVNFGSYCAKLRKAGETCANYNSNQHYYTFHCPCQRGLTCVPGGSVQLHPLLTIQTEATCKSV